MDKLLLFFALLTSCVALARAWRDHRVYRRLLDDLTSQVAEAERRVRLRAQMSNEIAHEIKNPLTAILCSAETLELLLGPQLPEDHKKSLSYIREYGDILLQLVTNFLDINRAEGGGIEATPQVINPVDLTDSVVGFLHSRAQARHITIECYAPHTPVGAMTDPRLFKQILFNLTLNAIKYIQEGGQVSITLTPKPAEGRLEVEVKDNGPGIPAAELPTIFNIYQRYEFGAAREEMRDIGHGLGLALCRKLVELCGGNISVVSTPGLGTAFTFSVPLAPEPPALPAPAHSEPAQPLLGLRFLIIDSDLGSREAISGLIQAWGGLVDRVGMAVDAVEAINEKSYDAVMIEDNVAFTDGCELTRLIKTNPQSKNTTVIVSGRDPNARMLAIESGADAYVEKPLNGTALLESLIPNNQQH